MATVSASSATVRRTPRPLLRASVDDARLHPTRCDECVDVGLLDPHVLAELGVGNPALVDEPADEPHGGAEAIGGLVDVEQSHHGLLSANAGRHRGEDGSASRCNGQDATRMRRVLADQIG
jgi:hypothetical protein